MKKSGFTLAEILITLGIIGVISALVIPQFVGNTYDQANASKLSSIVSDYENVFGHMLLREDRENIYQTAFGMEYNVTGNVDTTNVRNALERYTKINRISTNLSNVGYALSYLNNPLMPAAMAAGPEPPVPPQTQTVHLYTINGVEVTLENVAFALSTPGGAILIFNNVQTFGEHSVGDVYIDVNGGAGPNRFGRDIFAFVLAEDGHLYSFGSTEASRLRNAGENLYWNTTDNNNFSCNNGTYNGLGCTARLIENNYKMDY